MNTRMEQLRERLSEEGRDALLYAYKEGIDSLYAEGLSELIDLGLVKEYETETYAGYQFTAEGRLLAELLSDK